MRQCFAIEYLEDDNSWAVALCVIGSRRDIEADLNEYGGLNGLDPQRMRLRWVWTTAEANALRESGIKMFERPGGVIAWVA